MVAICRSRLRSWRFKGGSVRGATTDSTREARGRSGSPAVERGGAATAPMTAESSLSGQPATPMIRQYLDAKARAADAFLFFRLGDFYELFFEDAVRASELLGITLTARSK